MPKKCPNCKEPIIEKPISRLPLWIEPSVETGQVKRKFNWPALKWENLRLKNLIIGDWINFIVIVSVLFVAWAYSHDSGAYREIYSNPCGFVLKNYQTCYNNEQLGIQRNLSIGKDLFIRESNYSFNVTSKG